MWDRPDMFSDSVCRHDLQFHEVFINVGFDQLLNEATKHPSGIVVDLRLVTHDFRVS